MSRPPVDGSVQERWGKEITSKKQKEGKLPRCKYRLGLRCGVPYWQCPWCKETLFLPSPAELGIKAVG